MHLFIFLLAILTTPAHTPAAAMPASGHVTPEAPGPHEIFGIIRLVEPTSITVQRHNGQLIVVDITYAREVGRTGPLYVKRAVGVYGDFERVAGRYRANAITNANGIERGIWPPDR